LLPSRAAPAAPQYEPFIDQALSEAVAEMPAFLGSRAIEEAGEGGNWALLPPFPILPELPTPPSADQPIVGHYQMTRFPLANRIRHGRPP
jgi:hypothetical protein